MAYNQITTHVADAKERIIEQHKDKPNIESVFEIFTERIQAIEDDLQKQYSSKALSTATGSQLDSIAKDVGILRQASDDEELRARCFGAVAQHWSVGKIETVITIIKLLCNVDTVYIREEFPAKVAIQLITDVQVNREIRAVVQSALVASVNLESFIIVADVNYFGFENDWRSSRFATIDEPDEGGYFAIEF